MLISKVYWQIAVCVYWVAIKMSMLSQKNSDHPEVQLALNPTRKAKHSQNLFFVSAVVYFLLYR